MCSRTALLRVLVVLLSLGVATARIAGQVPTPVFQGIKITASVNESGGFYTYSYGIDNPPSNSLRVWLVDLDTLGSPQPDLMAPQGWNTYFRSKPESITYFASHEFVTWGTTTDMVQVPGPGTTTHGLQMKTDRVPQIRDVAVHPRLVEYLDALFDQREAQGLELDPEEQTTMTRQLIFHTETLGPLGVPPGSFAHWDTFIADVGKAGPLGWIGDPALLAFIQSNLSSARQAALAQDPATVNARLQAVINAIQASTPAQRTDEGYALVFYNAQYLQQGLPQPCEPRLTLAPASATHAVGETHTAIATLVNVANGQPIAGNTLRINVTDGPNKGKGRQGATGSDGTFTFSYVGTRLGTDTLVADTGLVSIRKGDAAATAPTPRAPAARRESASACSAYGKESAPATVTWQGGPDLTVPTFVPPVLISAPGRTFFITETTANQGTLPAGPSTTRYYLATSSPVDPATAVVVGERSVPPLGPGESSVVREVPYLIPDSLPAGTYHLDACADADGAVVETDETNNCASSRLQLVAGARPANRPPDCSKAAASPTLLWPPDHKMVSIAVTGVTDPDGDPVTVIVTGITQDEPTNGLGDGDTCPDATGVGTGQAQVRAERSGTGNGRVYTIRFSAADGKGGTCTGAVTVSVPHDKKDTPADDGQTVDATLCPSAK